MYLILYALSTASNVFVIMLTLLPRTHILETLKGSGLPWQGETILNAKFTLEEFPFSQ